MGDYVVKVRKDLTGCVFGRLTVVAQAEDYIQPNGTHCVQWLCRCSCPEHNMVVVKGSNLNGNKTLSCGRLARERAAEIRKNITNIQINYLMNMENIILDIRVTQTKSFMLMR